MFCPKCGMELPADSTFCASCGTQLNAVTPEAAPAPAAPESVPVQAAPAAQPEYQQPQYQQPQYQQPAPATPAQISFKMPATATLIKLGIALLAFVFGFIAWINFSYWG